MVSGLCLALAAVYVSTPLAIRAAARFEFYDTPAGYKGHAAPTPYLGGAAVITGFILTALVLGADAGRSVPLVFGVVVLWIVGTIDDRRTVSWRLRMVIEASLAMMLWALDLGWTLESGAALDLGLTILWVVAVVNAINLFDNMDGAASTMALVVAAGAAALGVVNGDVWLSVVAVALSGACLGFLPHNLAPSGARIFLGDGGSMPIGFAVAALVMIGASNAAPAGQALLIGLLLVGVPALDTCLVVISRTRRGISILTGGRDHLTHRTRQRLRTARAVAVALGSVQAMISALALVAIEGGSAALVGATLLYLVALGSTIALLDRRMALAPTAGDSPAPAPSAAVAGRRVALPPPRRILLVAMGLVLAASPFDGGYYDSRAWVPAGLLLIVTLTAALIARPPRMSASGWLVAGGLVGLATVALASAVWAESIEQAVIDGNRYALYAALFGVFLVLLRDRTDAVWLLGTLGVVGAALAMFLTVRLLGDSPGDLLLAGRLNEPLGYINGQANYFLLAMFPCLALAEQKRSAPAAGLGLACVVLLTSLTLLTQSRGAALALLASLILVLAVAPGRLRRAWALVVAGAAVALAGPALLDVYSEAQGGSLTTESARSAAFAALILAALAGCVWAAASFAVPRMTPHLASRARTGLAMTLALGVLGFFGLAAVNSGRIADVLSTQYRAFTLHPEPGDALPSNTGASRLVSGAGNRYDYWRVASDAWADNKLLGVGAGNYDGPYFLGRATAEDVRQPHSIELQAFSETGVLGGLALLLVLAGMAVAVARTVGPAHRSRGARFVLVAGGGSAVAWLAQTSVDWMHLLPGLTGMGLAGVAALAASGEEPRRVRPKALVVIGLTTLIAVAGISLTRQGLAERFRRAAQNDLATRPADALRDANRSLRLDSEAVGTYYVKAAAFARYGEADAAEATLRAAAAKEPRDFVTWTLLGDLAVRRDRLEEARRFYRRALAFNPLDASLQRLAVDPKSVP